jgi:hypothetical protein
VSVAGRPRDLDPRWVGAVIPKEHWHFHRQLLDRYNIVLAPGEFSMIVEAIESGGALLVEKRGKKQAIYSVRIPSAGDRVYILAAGRNLVTAWPPQRRLNDVRRKLVTATAQGHELAALGRHKRPWR